MGASMAHFGSSLPADHSLSDRLPLRTSTSTVSVEAATSSDDPGWQAALDQHQWPSRVSEVQAGWVATLTFKNEIHPEAADKRFRVWLDQVNRPLYGKRWRQRNQGVYWAKALEWQKRNVIHFHLLMSDTQNLNETLRRLTFMDKWKNIAGFSRIEVPNLQQCVTRYCAKYIIKGGEIDLSPTLGSYARQT
jgi:hypothetical protein